LGTAQKRAIQSYRSRLGARGLARFEVLARDADKELIRSLARRLADGTPESAELRAAVIRSVAGEVPKAGGVLAALRRSPLVGAGIDVQRPHDDGRKIDL
jgi:hypothetical protein